MNNRNLWFRRVGFTVFAFLLTGLSACLMREVDGERSADMGACPEGEVCSDVTPTGLRFVGAFLFDNETLRLGPVIQGGTFELGIRAQLGETLPDYAFEIENGTVMQAERGLGTFGPVDDEGTPLYPVDGHLALTGTAPGESYVRIVDPSTGELFDRLPLDVVEISDVRLINVNDGDRADLLRGENELLGIRLVAAEGGRQIRAIDNSLEFRTTGNVQPELMYWDCFTYEVPMDVNEVTFEIVTGGQMYVRTRVVRDATPEELAAAQARD